MIFNRRKARRTGAKGNWKLQRPTARTDQYQIAPTAGRSAERPPMPATRKRTRPARPARATKANSTAPEFVIVPKKGPPGAMLADPLRMQTPTLVTATRDARVFHGRASAHKFLKRNPNIKRHFAYQRAK